MATLQTVNFFKQYKDELCGPCLEIGSLIDPSYNQYLPKSIHGDHVPVPYIGIDIFEGQGVDYVIDLCKDSQLDLLPVKSFKTIHCHYIMEHVIDNFSMARNIHKLLDVGGVLLLSVPFSWRLHRIPVDMWRYTPQSLDYLFPDVEFIDAKSAISVRKGDRYYKINEFPELDLGSGLDKYPRYISWYIKALRRLGLHHDLFNQRALLPETNLMMYGVKRDKPTYTYIDPKHLK